MNLIIASIIYEQGFGSLESWQISWKPFLKNTKIGQRLIGAMRPTVLLSWIIRSISSYLRKFQGNPIVNSCPQPLTLLERGGGLNQPALFSNVHFSMKKGFWRSQISWLFLIHYELSDNQKKIFWFFTVFWGDLEGAGWFSTPPQFSSNI